MLQAAADQHRKQKQTAKTTAAGLKRLWQRHVRVSDLDGSWGIFGSLAVPYLIGAQSLTTDQALAYLPVVLSEQGIDDDPLAGVVTAQLIGIASDGRDLDSLLYSPITTVKSGIADGMTDRQALAAGLSSLERIAQTQVQDAGRVTTGLGVTVRPNLGYVRALSLPSCPRCVILAGRFYKWNRGFERHPQCDCLHIPSTVAAADGLAVDPRAAFDAGQVRGLSQADQRAIADGADISQVVNAHRGMSTAQVYGRRLKISTEGTTRRGIAGKRLGDFARGPGGGYSRSRTPRLMPESIYRIAGDDHAEAMRLLTRFGYIQ